ncbi:MAG: hypothetical protein AAF984_00130 [Verrucomicrobiota bacterium]
MNNFLIGVTNESRLVLVDAHNSLKVFDSLFWGMAPAVGLNEDAYCIIFGCISFSNL